MDAKLTAYALNEMPPDERAAFEAQMKNDPALQKQAGEMVAFCAMLEREVGPQAGDTLSQGQRADLVQRFQTAHHVARPIWRRPAFLSTIGLAAAACIAVMLTIQHARNPKSTLADLEQRTERQLLVRNGKMAREESGQIQDQWIAMPSPVAQKRDAVGLNVDAPMPAPASAPALASPPVVRDASAASPAAAAPSLTMTDDARGNKNLGADAGSLDSSGTGTVNLRGLERKAKAAAPAPSDNYGDKSVAAIPPVSMTAGGTIATPESIDGLLPNAGGTKGDKPSLLAGRPVTDPSNLLPESRSHDFEKTANMGEVPNAPLNANAGNLTANGGISGNVTTLNKDGSRSLRIEGSSTATGGVPIIAGEPKANKSLIPAAARAAKPKTELTRVTSRDSLVNGTSAGAPATPGPAQPQSGAGGGMGAGTGVIAFSPATAPNGAAAAGGFAPPAIPATPSTTVDSDDAANRYTYNNQRPSPSWTGANPDPRIKSELDRLDEITTLRQPVVENERLSRKPAGPNTATYRPIVENPFQYVAQQPLSTFSLDVDTASYANVRRFLNSGQRPPPDAVRLEELVNYFPYHYEEPAANRPIRVQVDLAEAPWQPLHRIARVAVKARDVKGERSAANFVFLLDVSGSMEPTERLPLIKQGLQLLVDQLREDDRVAIVTYAGESGVALESTPGAQKEKIRQAIAKLRAGGSTNGASGIRLAYEQAALNFAKERINRVILCTDGDFNVGTSSVSELEKLIAEKAKSGVFLSVLGVGTDNLHDHTMQALADRGNGNYHYLDALGEARKVLVDQMTGTLVTVAKDVKVQIEFNPAQVAAYRLIGYEKRLLAKEDFNNDKKDAGEIGAGHTVTALYEVVPASLKYPDGNPLVDDLKYATSGREKGSAPAETPAAAEVTAKPASPEAMTVKVRYKEPNEEQSKLFEVPVTDAKKKLSENDRDFQFAVSVAGFGMLLRGSPNAGELSWDNVRRLALAGKGDDDQGWRGEFIQLIEKARGLSEERR